MSGIKRNNKKGDAIIVVVCIMAILITLCLAMLLAASVLISNVQSKAASEQCQVSAITMSKELEKRITAANASKDTNNQFYKYIRNQIKTDGNTAWPYYNNDELGHGENFPVYKNMSMAGNKLEETGKISLHLYWEWEQGAEKSDILLHVDVTAEKSGQKHIIYSTYSLFVPESVSGDGDWEWDLDERM